MKQSFYSNGKLLITGEYVVLDGAKALAIPTQKGQSLEVKENNTGILTWNSFDHNAQIWYSTQIATKDFSNNIAPKGNSKFDTTLFKILWTAKQYNPTFLIQNKGYEIETYLTFDRLWGLGTSSTLINNIAQWAKINPFQLLHQSFGGSGYDIACASNNTPIFYQLNKNKNTTKVIKTTFEPAFHEFLFFIYLKEKKDSKDAIKNYRNQSKENLSYTINQINILTNSIVQCTNLLAFENLINDHEKLIASLLKTTTVKQDRFKDYSGAVKSLGGWGGDFVLATGAKENMDYFQKKGYHTIIPFNKMIYKG
ncbi:GYDIA family GHMP kinase [Aquimarina agarivorans]|uniref:GYDIA family GHMP kinase n=1 Tax=Aquimarina agarivorans TaxID=980584 RepID=UPI000248FB2B|nr:GYDIA family GHMP kinase [Aquimarina agarivorans]